MPSNPFLVSNDEPVGSVAVQEKRERDVLLGEYEFTVGPQQPPRTTTFQGRGFPLALMGEVAPVWLMGVHGGAGASTLASLLTGAAESHQAWPLSHAEEPPAHVLLVARTHAHGLAALKRATSQWASGELPEAQVQLLGTVLVADGPSPAKALVKELRQVGAMSPRTWHLTWNEQWRSLTSADDHPLNTRGRMTVRSLSKALSLTPKNQP